MKYRSKAALALWLVLFALLPVQGWAAQKQRKTIAGLDVVIWGPDRPDASTIPIIYSHGFRQCHYSVYVLGKALADANYMVFAPLHKDSTCHPSSRGKDIRFTVPLGKPKQWSDATYNDRHRDIKALVDALSQNPAYKPMDWKHAGLIGHSLGGYTVLGLAGAWPAWKDPRFKAVLALAPYARPFMAHHTLQQMDVPVMYQSSGGDGFKIEISRRGGVYDQTVSSKSYVEFLKGGHSLWGQRNVPQAGLIGRYGVAFFDYYLRHKPFPKALENPKDPMLSDLRLDRMKRH